MALHPILRPLSMAVGSSASPIVVVQGASRGLGNAIAKHILETSTACVLATCRTPQRSEALWALQQVHGNDRLRVVELDVCDDGTVGAAAAVAEDWGHVHALFNVAGVLEDEALGVHAEKKVEAITKDGATHSFLVNAVGPMLVAKHFSPLLVTAGRRKDSDAAPEALKAMGLPARPTAAFFSARVGSIADNSSGGWYSYRASKAALNAFVKSLSFELRSRKVCAVSLHPGTVDTDLTRAFLSARAKYDVQPVATAAQNLVDLVASLSMEDTGKFFDWKRQEVPW